MGSMNVVDHPECMQGPRPWPGAWPTLLSVCLSQLPRDDPRGLVGEGGRRGGREEAGVSTREGGGGQWEQKVVHSL